MSLQYSKNTRLLTIGGCCLFAVLCGLLVYRWIARLDAVPPQPPLPIVRVIEFAAAPEWETKSFPGFAKESQIAKLSFRVAGKMIETNIVVGAKILKGGIVARLDPRDYELTVKRLRTELQAAESLFDAMKTGARPEDIASLESQLSAAQTAYETAETNLDRFTALLADSVASQSQYDQAKTQFETAKGNKETLENELEKAKTGSRKEEIAAAQSRIEGLKASLDTAENALEDTFLKAPFDGMIVEKFMEDHEVLAPGIPVASFVDTSRIDVAVSLPEEMIVRTDDIRGYRVEFESYPGYFYPAQLKEIGRAVQRGRQTYPLQVRVDLDKDQGEEKRSVFPGMTAMVFIDLARPNRPQTVPPAALLGEGESTAVWVLEPVEGGLPGGGKLFRTVRRPVKLLRIDHTQAEIESDLKPHEKIVAAGAKSLRENQTVKVEQ